MWTVPPDPPDVAESRAAFEAWISLPPIEARLDRRPTSDASWPGQYFDYPVQLAWEAWQAAVAELKGPRHGDPGAPSRGDA